MVNNTMVAMHEIPGKYKQHVDIIIAIAIACGRILQCFMSIKTHGSESRGQEEAACMRVFWPTRPLQ